MKRLQIHSLWYLDQFVLVSFAHLHQLMYVIIYLDFYFFLSVGFGVPLQHSEKYSTKVTIKWTIESVILQAECTINLMFFCYQPKWMKGQGPNGSLLYIVA